MANNDPVPIAQPFRMCRFGGRRDIFFHAEDVLAFIARSRDVQTLPEAFRMVESMRQVIESAYAQAIKVADNG